MTYHEMSQIMDFLYAQRVGGLPPSALAEVFDRMIWCLADQGETLLQVREAWLTSDEKGKIEIALAMEETYPFNDSSKMETVLSKIALRWPDLAGRCEELVNTRRIEASQR